MIKHNPRAGAAYLDAEAAARYLGINRDRFYELAAEYRGSRGRSGFGPALYFSERIVKWHVADLDRCAHRCARWTVCAGAQKLNAGRKRAKR